MSVGWQNKDQSIIIKWPSHKKCFKNTDNDCVKNFWKQTKSVNETNIKKKKICLVFSKSVKNSKLTDGHLISVEELLVFEVYEKLKKKSLV